MRWPRTWTDATQLTLLQETPVDYLLVQDTATASKLRNSVEALRLPITVAGSPPSGVRVIEGDWPGTKALAPGQNQYAAAGPTGEPWIDSNGWKIALADAMNPGTQIWVDAAPAPPQLYPESYVIAVSDAGAQGGAWVISLDDQLAAGIAKGDETALATWKRVAAAASFFAARRWHEMRPAALIGVISDFTGDNEYLSHELLNLLARVNQQVRVLPLNRLAASSLSGLRAVIYADVGAPAVEVKKLVAEFVEQGGTLVAGPTWGIAEGAAVPGEAQSRYDVRRHGKGQLAVARKPVDDPYLLAQDSSILVSHRYDLLRIWNGGAVRACLAESADRKRGLLQFVFYANAREGDASVRVAGAWRKAKLFTLEAPDGRDATLVPEDGAVEVHLPAVAQYAAVELEA